MAVMLLGSKLGMTRFYTEDGVSLPVTVLQVGPCVVTQIRTPERDGYAAIQLGFMEAKVRRSTRPIIGHDAKAGSPPLRFHREFHVEPSELDSYEIGQTLTVEALEGLAYVDVSATSIGKGFQGGMKRHGFSGLEASHGVERKHRSPGSIGGHSSNLGTGPKVKKGKRMSGHMGDVRITCRSCDLVHIDKERGLLLVKGSIPGPNSGLVEIRNAIRLYSSKMRKQLAMASG